MCASMWMNEVCRAEIIFPQNEVKYKHTGLIVLGGKKIGIHRISWESIKQAYMDGIKPKIPVLESFMWDKSSIEQSNSCSLRTSVVSSV